VSQYIEERKKLLIVTANIPHNIANLTTLWGNEAKKCI